MSGRGPVVAVAALELPTERLDVEEEELAGLGATLLEAAQADITKWLAAGTRMHNIAGQFALSDTAQAHLAVDKGDKLGTVIVDCAR